VSAYLAIDTATDTGSVAVGEPGTVWIEVMIADRRHASALVPAIDQALRLGGVGYEQLVGIVVADGPGSFTGLRIGFATAKGILQQHDGLALYTAPSLLATAWGAAPFACGPVAALYDALRGEVFAAVYEFEVGGESGKREAGVSRLNVLVAPELMTVPDLAARCPVTPALAVGDGAAAHPDEIRSWIGRAPAGPPAGTPRASALLDLLALDDGAARTDDPLGYEPVYGRVAEAQARWERAHGRPLSDPTR
jgi:tRNA threonylcarbamoyladenosine biosynthesis protein TsaB